MLVLLSCGPNTEKVITTIKKQIDSVDFYYFKTVDEFINQSKLRRLAFDRLVFTQKFISSESEMGKFAEYVSNNMSSAEIVMLLQKGFDNIAVENSFTKYFDSPMHTLMYVDSPTARGMIDAVTLPIVDVRARYYSLDKSGSGDSQIPKLGLFKGGKKNNLSNSPIQKNSQEVSLNEEIVGVDAKTNIDKPFVENIVNPSSNGSNVYSNLNTANSDIFSKSDFSENMPVSHYNEKFDGENSVSTNDDLDLSIGNYGSQHSDSGFVGDDEILELENYANNRQSISDIGSHVSDIPSPAAIINSQERSSVNLKFSGDGRYSNNLNSNVGHRVMQRNGVSEGTKKMCIVTGLRGSGASAFVINTALKASKSGKKVLIVDLDYKACGILSFINVKSFYDRGCNGGNRMYTEDGVDILSNGYDMPNRIGIESILRGKLSYDLIIVDCPIDCLSVIPDEGFCNCNVIVGSITDISKLIETSASLSNRDLVSLKKEIHIAKSCQVPNKRISRESVEEVKSMMLFPNGCWLDNI